MLKHFQEAKSFARKTKRGFNLIETSLTIGILVITFNTGLQVWNDYVFRKSLSTEAQQVSLLADAAKQHVLFDVNKYLGQASSAPNRILNLNIDDLVASESYSLTAPRSTTRRRDLSVFLWSPTATSLIVFAQASFPTGQTGRLGAPRHEDNITQTAWVPPYRLSRLEGVGVNYDIQHLKDAGRTFEAGDFVALEYISLARDVSPYLHRAFNPEVPELTRMEADLDLNNHKLLNVGSLAADEISVQTSLNTNTITGDLTVAGNVTIAGSFDVGGDINIQGDATVVGQINTDVLTVDQNVITGAFTSNTGSFTTLSADDITSTGVVTAPTVATRNLSSNTVSAVNGTGARIETDTLLVNGRTTASQVVTTTLTTGSCSGC